MKKNNFTRIMLLSALILIIAVPSQPQYREAKLFAITTWNAGCSGSARPAWDNMELAWYDEITSVYLPKHVKADGIKANYKNAVLTVNIPKSEEAKPKEIAIS